MNFLFIGLGIALLAFAAAQLFHIVSVYGWRNVTATTSFAILKPVYVGISAALGLWLLSLGGVL